MKDIRDAKANQQNDQREIGRPGTGTVNKGQNPPTQGHQSTAGRESPAARNGADAAQEPFGLLPLMQGNTARQLRIGGPDERLNGQ